MSAQGRTTRVVEAVATRKGGSAAGQIVRSKHTVILDDLRLRFPDFDEENDEDRFLFFGRGGEFDPDDF
jgi:hypothetical protein